MINTNVGEQLQASDQWLNQKWILTDCFYSQIVIISVNDIKHAMSSTMDAEVTLALLLLLILVTAVIPYRIFIQQ